MRMKFIFLIFLLSFECQGCFSNEKNILHPDIHHIDFVITVNDKYAYGLVDSVFYYDSTKKRYVELDNLSWNFGGFDILTTESYQNFFESDTIVFKYQYKDCKNNFYYDDKIKMSKSTCDRSYSFLIEIEGRILHSKKRKYKTYELTHRFICCCNGIIAHCKYINIRKKR